MTSLLPPIASLVERADHLVDRTHECVGSFWVPALKGFFYQNPSPPKLNVSSTCFAAVSLHGNRAAWSAFATGEFSNDESLATATLRESILVTEWTSEGLGPFNPYTTPIAICCVHELGWDGVENLEKVEAGVAALLESVTDAGAVVYRHHLPDRPDEWDWEWPANAYLTYWALKAISAFLSHSPDSALVGDTANALARGAVWAGNEVHRQVALHAAGDAGEFDASQLIYALAAYRMHSGRVNERLVRHANSVIWSVQLVDGLWPAAREPIFPLAQIGGARPFSYEMVDALLESGAFQIESHIGGVELLIRWAEDNLLRHEFGDGRVVLGWCSNLLPNRTVPQAWSTASVLNTCRRLRRELQAIRQREILTEFHAPTLVVPPKPDALNEFFGDIPSSKERVGDVLRRHVVDREVRERARSVLLFGPPGTGKTTLAQLLADALGWPLVKVGVSRFLRSGYESVAAEAEEVFRQLSALEEAVVLFDEFEELCRRRGPTASSAYTNMLTDSTLELIDRLKKDCPTIVFVASTNHRDRIDPATLRQGRLDLQLYIGWASAESVGTTFEASGTGFSEADLPEGWTSNRDLVTTEEWRRVLRIAREASTVELREVLSSRLPKLPRLAGDADPEPDETATAQASYLAQLLAAQQETFPAVQY